MHHLHTVKGHSTAVIQIADTGVSVVFWTMSAVFIHRGETHKVPSRTPPHCMESGVCHQNNSKLIQC